MIPHPSATGTSHLKEFQQKEIRGLKRLRNFLAGIFVLIPLGLFTYMVYAVYMNFIERDIRNKTFFEFALPLLGVLLLLFLVFLPIILFTSYRVNRFIQLLFELDAGHLLLYQQYTKAVPRLSANIAPYLFAENDIIIPKLLKINRVPYSGIMEISYKRFKSGRSYGITITLETYHHQKHHISFFLDEKLRFFLDVIAQKHLHIPVIRTK
ncbi:hypothetical protein U0035_18110 [Niabella yanshanensis]|uniref:Bacterial Pleckstrin homology domain-containing protein n=1 Tax=Niabella yanshanensis TaxID=577386 RepID=A0ABZ0W642_9BACT|nr:hypothetical protein [Niabella yanshanensis]WQD37590.1 hypothetical protein U0035_18110 [Niabella yanshanensis]